jgi:hypothetical protein
MSLAFTPAPLSAEDQGGVHARGIRRHGAPTQAHELQASTTRYGPTDALTLL